MGFNSGFKGLKAHLFHRVWEVFARKYCGITRDSNKININPLKAELNHICHLLALLGAHHILHISRIRVNTSK